MPTWELPIRSLHAGEAWSPHELLAFTADCLAWMRSVCGDHSGPQQVRFTFEPLVGAIRWQAVAGGGALPGRVSAVLSAGKKRRRGAGR